MLELTGIASVLRGISFLYWVLAAVALVVVLKKAKTRRATAIGVLVVIVVFSVFPLIRAIDHWKHQAYAREAWAYFKTKCETEAGEKIYKTYSGVKSVLVVKPLPPATEKDLFDQFWYGDPYSNATAHEKRAESAALILASPRDPIAYDQIGNGFNFVESVALTKGDESKKFKYYYPQGPQGHRTEIIDRPVSRFGISWEDMSKPEDRKYWVAGSRLRIIDLTDNSIVAERIGFIIEAGFGSHAAARRPWLASRGPNTTCPQIRNGTFEDRWFVLRVLKPTGEAEDGK